MEVGGYSNVSLPKGMLVNDSIADPKTFVYLLKQAVIKPQFGKFSGNYASASLPESKSFVRVIQVPRMSDSELDVAVPLEAESFIPLPLDQVYLDWQKLGTKDQSQEILIIASPKEFVDKYLKILEDAGLEVSALEVESQSCHRALVPAALQANCLIVDLDSFRTSLIMVENGHLEFTSSIPIAGSSFTEAIARSLGVSSQKAEIVKRKVGVANTAEYPNIKTALLPVLASLSAEIKNIIKFHSEHSQNKVDKIILAGGSAKLKNLGENLQPEFSGEGIIVESGNPWINLPQIKNPPLDAFDSLSFTTAIGLAMRGINE
ncbi:MAG: cell division protein FtsA [Bacteroidetes bacterium OLB12]|nr:MAG: cell division protein FtsA [Bacteroidetes bacterium OLB12]